MLPVQEHDLALGGTDEAEDAKLAPRRYRIGVAHGDDFQGSVRLLGIVLKFIALKDTSGRFLRRCDARNLPSVCSPRPSLR